MICDKYLYHADVFLMPVIITLLVISDTILSSKYRFFVLENCEEKRAFGKCSFVFGNIWNKGAPEIMKLN